LTASYPSEDGKNWLAAAKDHGVSDPSSITVYAVGIAKPAEAKLVSRVSQLLIQTQPGNVQVYLDDAFKGITSDPEGRLRIESLAPGSYQLRLTLPGYKHWKLQVTLAGGETLPVTAKLEQAGPKPLALDEVEEALKNGISAKRVGELVKQYGVDFDLTGEVEQRLRAVGADDALLLLVSKSRK
jgi:hypothetical protein